MFKFFKNLFFKNKKKAKVVPFSTNRGLREISKIEGVTVKQFGEGEYGIAVDTGSCPLTPGELIQKLIEGSIE